jgi:hypothetical protein
MSVAVLSHYFAFSFGLDCAIVFPSALREAPNDGRVVTREVVQFDSFRNTVVLFGVAGCADEDFRVVFFAVLKM